MAVTLVDYLKAAKTPFRASIIQNLLRYSDLMGLVPFESVEGLKIKARRWETLPSVSWLDIGGSFGTGTGEIEELEEALYWIGHNIDIPKPIMRAKNQVVDPMVMQIQMVTKALAFDFNNQFINGDPTVDAKTPWGLKYRIGKLPSSQIISHDVAAVMGTDAKMQNFLDDLNALINRVGGAVAHEKDDDPQIALLMNRRTFEGVQSILRRQKLLDVTQDQFGRRIPSYMGARLIDVGLKADKSTQIITDTEAATAGNVSSSVYAVKLGAPEDEALTGIELYPLETNDVGLVEAGTAYRSSVDWLIGFLAVSDYYAARLYKFQMTAA